MLLLLSVHPVGTDVALHMQPLAVLFLFFFVSFYVSDLILRGQKRDGGYVVVARRNMLLLRKWGGAGLQDRMLCLWFGHIIDYKNNKLAPNPERGKKSPPGGESERLKTRQNGTSDSDDLNFFFFFFLKSRKA